MRVYHHPSRTGLFAQIFSILVVLLLFAPTQAALLGHKWEAASFCKCICFGSNYTILHLDNPDNPSKPCLSCTKQWCINQNLPICQGANIGDMNPDTPTGKQGDVEARCFQRDSPRDQLIVTLFLLTIFGLLLGAGIKEKMLKAGIDTSVSWNQGRKWWGALLPQTRLDEIGLHERRSRIETAGLVRENEARQGVYSSIPNADM